MHLLVFMVIFFLVCFETLPYSIWYSLLLLLRTVQVIESLIFTDAIR